MDARPDPSALALPALRDHEAIAIASVLLDDLLAACDDGEIEITPGKLVQALQLADQIRSGDAVTARSTIAMVEPDIRSALAKAIHISRQGRRAVDDPLCQAIVAEADPNVAPALTALLAERVRTSKDNGAEHMNADDVATLAAVIRIVEADPDGEQRVNAVMSGLMADEQQDLAALRAMYADAAPDVLSTSKRFDPPAPPAVPAAFVPEPAGDLTLPGAGPKGVSRARITRTEQDALDRAMKAPGNRGFGKLLNDGVSPHAAAGRVTERLNMLGRPSGIGSPLARDMNRRPGGEIRVMTAADAGRPEGMYFTNDDGTLGPPVQIDVNADGTGMKMFQVHKDARGVDPLVAARTGLFGDDPATIRALTELSEDGRKIKTQVITPGDDEYNEDDIGVWVTHPTLGRVKYPGLPEQRTYTWPDVTEGHGYDAPRPSDLPRIRRKLAEYYSSPQAIQEIAMSLGNGQWTLRPMVYPEVCNPESVADLNRMGRGAGYAGYADMITSPGGEEHVSAVNLCLAETRRLTEAHMYYIDVNPTRMARSFGKMGVKEKITLDRAPSRSGFMLFAEPIAVYEQTVPISPVDPSQEPPTRTVPFVAVSWSAWEPEYSAYPLWICQTPDGVEGVQAQGEWIWLTFYTANTSAWNGFRDDDLVWATGGVGIIDVGKVRKLDRERGNALPLTWDTENAVRCGFPVPAEAPDNNDMKGYLVSTIYSAWQLIAQERGKKIDVTSLRVDMPTPKIKEKRSKNKKDAKKNTPAAKSERVNVVKIAPRTAKITTPGRDNRERNAYGHLRDHDHQWKVKEHKRMVCPNPWLHSENACGDHKETLIAEFFAGPWDKPLKIRDTVNVLKETTD